MTPRIIHLTRADVGERIQQLRSHFDMSDEELADRAANYLLSVEEQADYEEIRDLEFLQSA